LRVLIGQGSTPRASTAEQPTRRSCAGASTCGAGQLTGRGSRRPLVLCTRTPQEFGAYRLGASLPRRRRSRNVSSSATRLARACFAGSRRAGPRLARLTERDAAIVAELEQRDADPTPASSRFKLSGRCSGGGRNREAQALPLARKIGEPDLLGTREQNARFRYLTARPRGSGYAPVPAATNGRFGHVS
jgi:hypothetical protein